MIAISSGANMKRIHIRGSLMVALVLMISVVASLPYACAGKIPKLREVGSRHIPAAKSRKLVTKAIPADDPSTDCANKFPKLNYTPVTSACKPNEPTTRACCEAFNRFACQFQSQVNNFNTICPILFMSYLNYAGRYRDGYFIDKCVDGTKGLCV